MTYLTQQAPPLVTEKGIGGKMQMQSAVVSTGRRKKSERPGQSREDLNSPLLPHHQSIRPCPSPFTDTHRFIITTCRSTFRVELIVMFMSASHHPERLSAPKLSFILQILIPLPLHTDSSPSHTLPPFLKS